jgi:hypothetical protein
MKKIFILLFTLLTVNGANAQSCLPQGITFNYQTEIDSFQINYPNCTQIEGDVQISSYSITNLDSLSVLTSIGGALMIYVDVLSSLTGLKNLTSIGNGLIIQFNDSLTSLTGLENLSFLGYGIWFSDNHSLTSLIGLDNVTNSWSVVWITDNDTLSDCAVQSICNYISGSSAWIENNATGCNSQQEVELACGVGMEENNLFEGHLNIYPNPASTNITIETHIRGYLSVQNLNGQRLLQQRITELNTIIDIKELEEGIYFVKLVGENEIQIGKMIKK